LQKENQYEGDDHWHRYRNVTGRIPL